MAVIFVLYDKYCIFRPKCYPALISRRQKKTPQKSRSPPQPVVNMVIVVKDISDYVKGRQASLDSVARCLYAFYILGIPRNQLAKYFSTSKYTVGRWIKRYEDTKYRV